MGETECHVLIIWVSPFIKIQTNKIKLNSIWGFISVAWFVFRLQQKLIFIDVSTSEIDKFDFNLHFMRWNGTKIKLYLNLSCTLCEQIKWLLKGFSIQQFDHQHNLISLVGSGDEYPGSTTSMTIQKYLSKLKKIIFLFNEPENTEQHAIESSVISFRS